MATTASSSWKLTPCWKRNNFDLDGFCSLAYLGCTCEVVWSDRVWSDRVWSSMSLNESVYGFTVVLEFRNVCIWEMFRFITPSPMIPKTINLPLTFLFTYKIDQPLEHEPWEPEDNISINIINRSYCTKKIHGLCAKDRNVDEVLHLLDCLNLWGYRPLSQHQHHHSRTLASNRFYSLYLFILSPTSVPAMFLLPG